MDGSSYVVGNSLNVVGIVTTGDTGHVPAIVEVQLKFMIILVML